MSEALTENKRPATRSLQEIDWERSLPVARAPRTAGAVPAGDRPAPICAMDHVASGSTLPSPTLLPSGAPGLPVQGSRPFPLLKVATARLKLAPATGGPPFRPPLPRPSSVIFLGSYWPMVPSRPRIRPPPSG